MYHHITHAHLSQTCSQPALHKQQPGEGETSLELIYVLTTLAPQPTKTIVLPLFSLNWSFRHKPQTVLGWLKPHCCHAGQLGRHAVCACALQSPSSLACFFPNRLPKTHAPNSCAGKWRRRWSRRKPWRRLRRAKVIGVSWPLSHSDKEISIAVLQQPKIKPLIKCRLVMGR